MFKRIKNKIKKIFLKNSQKEILNQNKNINGQVLINQNQILKNLFLNLRLKFFHSLVRMV